MKKRSRLIKALDNRFYVKFMQLEIGLFCQKHKMHAENLKTINNIHAPSPKGRKFMVKEIKKTSVSLFRKKSFGVH